MNNVQENVVNLVNASELMKQKELDIDKEIENHNSCLTSNTFENLINLDNINTTIDINDIEEFIFMDDLLVNNNIESTEKESIVVEESQVVNECVTEHHNTLSMNVDESISNAGNSDEIDVYGKKKRKKDIRKAEKLCRETGEAYKRIKKDGSFQTIEKKQMKENPCLEKKFVNECKTVTEE